ESRAGRPLHRLGLYSWYRKNFVNSARLRSPMVASDRSLGFALSYWLRHVIALGTRSGTMNFPPTSPPSRRSRSWPPRQDSPAALHSGSRVIVVVPAHALCRAKQDGIVEGHEAPSSDHTLLQAQHVVSDGQFLAALSAVHGCSPPGPTRAMGV